MKHIKTWLLALCFTLCTLTLLCILPLTASTETTDFSVSKAFSSNMVIQRDEPIRVWGWANESRNGETVTATFAGKTAEGKIENGAWTVTFADGFAASAAMGNDMTVTCGGKKIVFEDVLVGDVYMVIGQSNVAYSVDTHCAYKGLNLNTFVDPNAPIRLKYNTLNDTAGYPARGTDEVSVDVVNGRDWWMPTAANVKPFTAIGYLFAREIVEKTHGEIPIGLIEIDGNGQPIGAFMPNEAAGATDSDTYNTGSGIFVPPGVNGTHARYMYNHYMYPYEQYAMAGVIWYQGESDFEQKNAETYVDKFTALMEHMHSTHNLKHKDFPVYIVELPTAYNKPADFSGDFFTMDLGLIRAELGSIPQRLENSYLAVSSDAFTDERFWNSLHPNIKDAQAKRLADLAGSVWYGLAPLDESTGPILKDYAISEDRKTVTLTFENVGEGLATSDGVNTVKGFVAFNRVGALSTTNTLTATITGKDQITVTAKSAMYGIAYNCVMDNFYGKQVNLCNSHGRIAAAFTFAEARMYQTRHEIIGENEQITTPAAEDVIAVHFRAEADMVAVGTQLYKDTVTGGTVTLSLYAFDTDYATTVAGKPLATETFTDADPYAWAELSQARNRTWDAGEYLLVITGAEGIGIAMGGSHEGQVCYRNGAYAEETSLLLGLTYDQKVEAAYGIPTDPNTEVESETAPDTVPDTETEPISETDPATDASETMGSGGTGCASTLGGNWLIICLMMIMATFFGLNRKHKFYWM